MRAGGPLLVLLAVLPAIAQEPERAWERQLLPIGRPVFGQDTVYFESSGGPTPAALDLRTGELVWSGPAEAGLFFRLFSDVLGLDGDRLYRLDAAGVAREIDRATGRVLRRIEESGSAHLTCPVAAGEVLLTLVAIDEGCSLRARDRDDSTLLWERRIPGPLRWPGMAAGEGRVFVAAGNGRILGLDAATGSPFVDLAYDVRPRVGQWPVGPRLQGRWCVARPADSSRLFVLDSRTGETIRSLDLEFPNHLAFGDEGLAIATEGEIRVIRFDREREEDVQIPIGELRATGEGVFEDGLLAFPTETPFRPEPGWAIHVFDAGSGEAIARLPRKGPGRLYLHDGVLLEASKEGIVAHRLAVLVRDWRRRQSFLLRLRTARETWDPVAFDLALELASAPEDRLEAGLGLAEAFLRAGRTRESLFAYLDLLADSGQARLERGAAPALDVGAHARTRLEILFDLAGRDAEHVEAYFERFRAAGADRRRLRGLPTDFVPPDLRE